MSGHIRHALLFTTAIGAMLMSSASYAGSFKTLHTFTGLSDGGTPIGTLLAVNGSLYGTTQFGGTTATQNCPDGCGVVFSVNAKSGKETVAYSFAGGSQDGAFPVSGLIMSGNELYGTTQLGGSQSCFESTDGCGTVFELNAKNGKEKILYAFGNEGQDGELPDAGVTLVGGSLYGTTDIGGAGQVGNIFSLNLATGQGSNLYSFAGYPTDEFPLAGLLNVNGDLYGTTSGQGQDFGTVFSFSTTANVEVVVHAFSGQDGSRPMGGLVMLNGELYGTTASGGGQRGGGTVFQIDPASGKETVIYSFTGENGDGMAPMGTLVSVSGMLYGTTSMGGNTGCTGNHGCGIIFEVNPSTGQETILHTFNGGSEEGNPQAGLTYAGGSFYGTTAMNGQNSCYNKQGCGTVFRYTP